MQRVKSTNCKINLILIVGDWTYAILFVGLCHMLSRRYIGQLYTIMWLLSDILGLFGNPYYVVQPMFQCQHTKFNQNILTVKPRLFEVQGTAGILSNNW